MPNASNSDIMESMKEWPYAIIVPSSGHVYAMYPPEAEYITEETSGTPRERWEENLYSIRLGRLLTDEMMAYAREGDLIRYCANGMEIWYRFDEAKNDLVGLAQSQGVLDVSLYEGFTGNPQLSSYRHTQVFIYEPDNLAHEVLLAKVREYEASS